MGEPKRRKVQKRGKKFKKYPIVAGGLASTANRVEGQARKKGKTSHNKSEYRIDPTRERGRTNMMYVLSKEGAGYAWSWGRKETWEPEPKRQKKGKRS